MAQNATPLAQNAAPVAQNAAPDRCCCSPLGTMLPSCGSLAIVVVALWAAWKPIFYRKTMVFAHSLLLQLISSMRPLGFRMQPLTVVVVAPWAPYCPPVAQNATPVAQNAAPGRCCCSPLGTMLPSCGSLSVVVVAPRATWRLVFY